MARAIFTSQTPGFTDEGDGAPGLTLGTVFNTSADTECNGIWWYFPATTPGATVLARLYDEDSQTLLASATFSASPTGGTWNLATFASPVTLTAGNNYVAAIWTPDRYVATGNLFGSAITNGTFTAVADDPGGVRNGRFIVNATPAYPNGSFGANGYFVDVNISEPVTVTIGQAVEVDTAGTATPSHVVALGQAQETDTAGTATASHTVAIGQATEVDTAQALTASHVVTLGQAVEVDTAGALTATGGLQRDLDITLGRPTEKWHIGRPAAKWHVGRVGS